MKGEWISSARTRREFLAYLVRIKWKCLQWCNDLYSLLYINKLVSTAGFVVKLLMSLFPNDLVIVFY